MARPKEFDEERAVESAMNAFWDNGYEATSTQDLCEATGLGRSSVYNTFKSKHALFERALTRYRAIGLHTRAELLDSGETGLDRVRAMLDGTVSEERANGGRGCLMVNAAAEFGDRDEAVRSAMRTDAEGHLALLAEHIRAGQADGTIDRRRAAADLAQFVYATVSGLRIMSRRGAGEPEMRVVADIAVDALRPRT
ncbi:TetR/AcrR family transcriptional regulator [Amycolatopsis sp. CA-230715]|uniref:TetR/AcrR family transcriptional regulator n=1 Tax=Amycolatopsis sp. CA-230715 TaxID=2745196 RepID=UPI001C017390|nr:TetR/AcrR family transcriptional regulator [Amycolatopsis sp. CA-230715]QWF85480.1 HTH-type transcriptional repressor ComR [Amycolatopsis sp. CA-230715]